MAIIQYIAITTSQKEGKLGSIIPNFRPKHGNLLQVKKISEFFPLFFQKTTFCFWQISVFSWHSAKKFIKIGQRLWKFAELIVNNSHARDFSNLKTFKNFGGEEAESFPPSNPWI